METTYFIYGAIIGIFTFGFGFIAGWNLRDKQTANKGEQRI